MSSCKCQPCITIFRLGLLKHRLNGGLVVLVMCFYSWRSIVYREGQFEGGEGFGIGNKVVVLKQSYKLLVQLFVGRGTAEVAIRNAIEDLVINIGLFFCCSFSVAGQPMSVV